MAERDLPGGRVHGKRRDTNRWLFWVIAAGVFLGSCVALTSFSLERSARRAATENGALRDFHYVTAVELSREVKDHVPLGSTRIFVEDYLAKQGIRFSFDPLSRAIYANAPYLKGSNFIVYESLGFTFHFDDALKLTSIDSRVHYTGP
jgi:hypothetical protein